MADIERASKSPVAKKVREMFDEEAIQSGNYCFDCGNTGKATEQNGPDDFDWVECHCKTLERAELEANV